MKAFFTFSSLLLLLCILACNATSDADEKLPTEAQPSAQVLVDSAIAAHGGAAFERQLIEFDFRDYHYRALIQDGARVYEREILTDQGLRRDVLAGQTLTRTLNGAPVALPDTTAQKYANSLNSVIYFALLPYFLDDPAVNKTYLGRSRLDSTDYNLIGVTFDQQGGGEDFDDEFLYWIHPETYRMPYLAYRYHTEGGGLRFRSAYHPRRVGGILFQDYVNYQADFDRYQLRELDSLYRAGALEELSRIELEGIGVR